MRASVVALLTCSALAFPGAASAAPILGFSDDAMMLRTTQDPGALLDVGRDHGAGVFRVIAYMGRDDDRIVAASAAAAERGMLVHATLSAMDFGQVDAPEFAAWAAGFAARLAAVAPNVTVGLLNEPDLAMPSGIECSTSGAIGRTVAQSGYRMGTRTVVVKVYRRVRVVRRVHGKRRVTHKRVRVYRIVKRTVRRHGRRVVIRRKVGVTRLEQRPALVATTEAGSIVSTTGPQTTCHEVQRARTAARFLRAAIPAVRAAAPGVRIDIGETSPVAGVREFIAELARVGVPHFDGYAHHPYPFIRDGRVGEASSAMLSAEQLPALAALVGDLWPGADIDLTEFGVQVQALAPEGRAQVWRDTYTAACQAGARSLVAYHWWPTGTGGWDTSVLAADGTDTVVSSAIRGLSC